LGLNLGPSPNHARSVNLVLNLSTGLCSPQFHCSFDDFFETTQLSSSDVKTTSLWKQLAGFSRHGETPTRRNLPVRPIGTTQAPPSQDTPDDDISFPNDVSTDDVNAALVSEGATDIVAGDRCKP
jgi:hypothetical protein